MDKDTNAAITWKQVIWLGIINCLLLTLVSLYFTPEIQGLSASTATFLAISFYAHYFFLSLLIITPVFITGQLIRHQHISLAMVITGFSLFLLVIGIDLKIYSIYRMHINGMIIDLLTSGAADDILKFSGEMNFYLAAIVGLILLSEYALFYIIHRHIHPAIKLRYLTALTALLMFGSQAFYAYADMQQKTNYTYTSQYIPWAQPITIRGIAKRFGYKPPDSNKTPVLSLQSRGFNYPAHPLSGSFNTKPYNIIFLVVDSLRFDMLNSRTMPTTYAFSRHAWTFKNHYSTGNSTRFGIYGMLSGLYGSYWQSSMDTRTGSILISELKKHDYDFAIYASAPLTFPEFDRTVFADVSQYITPSPKDEFVYDKDIRITNEFLNYIERKNTKPFFGFVFFDSPHGHTHPPDFEAPFQPEIEDINYFQLDKNFYTEGLFNLYKNSVYFVDAQINKILNALKNNSLLDNTIVIITGDHAQEFNDTKLNYWGHNGNFSDWQTRVPMVVYWPGKTAKEFSHLSSHIDIVPELMHNAFGITNPAADYSNGRLLSDTGPRDFVIINGWAKLALRSQDRINVYNEVGQLTIYDTQYHTLQNAELSTANIAEAFNAQTHFFK